MTISFECHPMETAPKDRVIMGWVPDVGWQRLWWSDVWNIWWVERNPADSPPLYWAEPSDMEPKV